MNIPAEWQLEICENLRKVDPMNLGLNAIFLQYWNTSFNNAWDIKLDQQMMEKFKTFFIKIATHQCNYNTHQLTCGIDSEHAYLVPRITYKGLQYLVCPTCGYTQVYP